MCYVLNESQMTSDGYKKSFVNEYFQTIMKTIHRFYEDHEEFVVLFSCFTLETHFHVYYDENSRHG